jgi:N-acetyl-anhydromuramyl-L-alanine amidase AmpD
MAIVIDKTKYILSENEYYPKEKFVKKQVILHHTAGWVLNPKTNKPSMSHFNGWNVDGKRVATAFSIDYLGKIYQHFDPEKFAYHTGLGSAYAHLDIHSIGIEITNEGWLTKKGDDFFFYAGKYNREHDETIFEQWRGQEWWSPYSEAQIEASVKLVDYLCDTYQIEKNFIDNNDYDKSLLTKDYKGILNHANIRTDKTDLSPAFPFEYFKKNL